MKLFLTMLMGLNVAYAATHTRVISKVTDTYQLRSGKAQLLETQYEVGTFNEVDGLATDIQTIIEKQGKTPTKKNKLERVIKISGSDDMPTASQKISSEECTIASDRKYCSTSIELQF